MIRLVVGLGNPGSRYEGTRHNVGFAVIDRLGARLAQSSTPVIGRQFTAVRALVDQNECMLLKPTTYMNRSGLAIAEALDTCRFDLSELLVVVDEFQFPTGVVKLRANGSDGGHNGLASIIQAVGSQEFARLRLGVGPLPPGINPADFVLARFDSHELAALGEGIDFAAEAVILAARHPLAAVMSKVNKNPAPPN